MSATGTANWPKLKRIDHALGFHYPDLQDFEFTLVVPERPIVKKNNIQIMRRGSFSSIGYKSRYARWEVAAANALKTQWSVLFKSPIPIDVTVNLCVLTYLPDRRGWPDLSASYEAPQDVLEAHRGTCKDKCRRHSGVIANDRQVCAHRGSDRLVDKRYPRMVIVITPHRGPA